MPLVSWDESPATGLCSQEHDAVPSCCLPWVPPPSPLTHHAVQQERPRSRCAHAPPIGCVTSARPPAVHPSEDLLHQASLGRWTDVTDFSCCHIPVPSRWRLYFPFKWQYALNWFTQQHHFESWKPQTEMSVQNKKALGSLRLKCSSQGQTRCLWVLRMSVLREPSKEHHSQLGIFQECSSPQKGNFSMGPSRLMSNPCINWENW